ncbi:MAG: SIMPL domain-containing protein, partial [Stagnimonas sp.]|nr:SIMPL domain-containing protein [Stagnimonas sp.]
MRRLVLLPLAASLVLFASTASAQTALARAVTVSGQGEATGAPDRARLTMAVEARNLDLRVAEAEANKVVRAYLAELKTLGLKDEDI